MSIDRTHNGGHCAVGSTLNVHNGACREVRGYILDREAAAKELRKTWRRKPKPRLNSKNDTFKEYVPPTHLFHPETRGY